MKLSAAVVWYFAQAPELRQLTDEMVRDMTRIFLVSSEVALVTVYEMVLKGARYQ